MTGGLGLVWARFTGVEVVGMALSEKARAKRAQQAARLLPPGANVRTLVQGHGHFRMTSTSITLLAVFGVAFVVALALGYVLIPGGIMFGVVWGLIRPRRDVVVTDQGLGLLHVSMFNGKPSKAVALLPPGPVWTDAPSGPATLELGPERVTLKRPEFDRLAAATTPAAALPAPAPGQAFPPLD